MAKDGERRGEGAVIETVVLDLGGVLFTEGKSVALEALCRDRGYDPAVVGEVMTCGHSRDLRKGLLSAEAFWAWAARWLPRGYDARAIRDAWHEGYVLDRDVFALAERLKGRYRIAAFSENVAERIAYLEEKYRFRRLFDVEVYSYEHHAGKRDPRFLEILLTTLGGRPEAVLYVDDSPDVLALAERRGVNVVLYATGRITRVTAAMRRLGMDV